MDSESIDIVQTLLGLKSQILSMYQQLEALELYIANTNYVDEGYDETLISTTGPMMFDGVFNTNTIGENSLIYEHTNDTTTTIHFTNDISDSGHGPYVFGRLLDINNKKIEGLIMVVIEHEEYDQPFMVLNISTEKLNYSHPGKTNGRIFLGLPDGIPLLPNGKLKIYLQTNEPLDTKTSKIVFEDLLFIGGI